VEPAVGAALLAWNAIASELDGDIRNVQNETFYTLLYIMLASNLHLAFSICCNGLHEKFVTLSGKEFFYQEIWFNGSFFDILGVTERTLCAYGRLCSSKIWKL